MRIVLYIRVSTEIQGTQGQSLENQARRGKALCSTNNYALVRTYEESASAGTVAKRRTFQRMLDELVETKPNCIMVDSADRFSRNLEDAFVVIDRLRRHGINIWPLDWERDKAPDILTYDSEDYIRFRAEIMAAQSERKRIKTRLIRSYQGRRERGATTHNTPPLGLKRLGDRLVENADTMWIVREMELRALRGDSYKEIARWTQSVHDRAPKHGTVVRKILSNETYVKWGARSVDTHSELAIISTIAAQRFGTRRLHDHELSGVVACGQCVDLGHPVANSLMAGGLCRPGGGKSEFPMIRCEHYTDGAIRHPWFTVAELRVLPLLLALMENAVAVATPERIERWAQVIDGDVIGKRLGLERRLSDFEQRAADLRASAHRANRLVNDSDPIIDEQGRKLLREIGQEERQLELFEVAVRAEIERVGSPRRDLDQILDALSRFGANYQEFRPRDRNRILQTICLALESHPVVYRDGRSRWAQVRLEWPELESLASAREVRV